LNHLWLCRGDSLLYHSAIIFLRGSSCSED